MKYLDLSLPTPEENLALDEALLLGAESLCGGAPCELTSSCPGEILRFWESSSYFVVLGAGGRADQEVHRDACLRDAIPVLRRASGGGSVVQGPGCLNFALVLDIELRPECSDIAGTNRYVLSRTVASLQSRWPALRAIGISDLALGDKKISGTAQRRKRRHVLFHGTLLYNFDLARLERYLRHPPKEPDYRAHRPHRDFVANLPALPETLRRLIAEAWDAHEVVSSYPRELIDKLVAEKYSREEWNMKF